MNLILLEPLELAGTGNLVRLADARARHLREVLKVTPGQTVRVGILNGTLGTATVEEVADATVQIRCAFDAAPPPAPRVDLLLALPRPKVMRRLWPQLAALGVGRILLTNAERVERHYFDTHVLSETIYRPLLIEGLQQARDTHLPEVSIHRRLKVLIEDDLDRLVPAAARLMADPGATRRIADAVSGPMERVLLAVGPEGGWNEFERSLLAAHRFDAVGLGARTLRSDTACVALLALVGDAMSARAVAGARQG
jgi:RsmE family RNA methyltransferase